MTASTLFDKVWKAHEVCRRRPPRRPCLYIDLHLVHEVTSPQAFSVLRSSEAAGPAARPSLATMTIPPDDHGSGVRNVPIKVDAAARQVRQLEQNAADFGVELFGMARRADADRTCHHPELGASRPGMTIVVRRQSYEHPWRLSAPSPSASGQHRSGHVLATQWPLGSNANPSRLPSTWTGHLPPGYRQGSDSCHHRQSGRSVVPATCSISWLHHSRTVNGRAHDHLQHVDRAGARAGMVAPTR